MMRFLLPHLIDAAAERSPDQEAFRFNGTGVPYAALASQSNRLAGVLRTLGVAPGDRVGLYLPKGLEAAVAVYGILKAGAAYVPLDPKLPAARLHAVLNDCGLRHVVTTDALRSRLDGLAATTPLRHLVGPTDHAEAAVPSISWSDVEAAPDRGWSAAGLTGHDLAYIMYTSGSTGLPKGIVHTHASSLSYATLAADVYGLRADDRLSGFPPLHFDQSIFDYMSGPSVGATTVIISEGHMMMPASLSQLMADERLTVWYSVPYALVQLLLRGALDQRDLSSLRWVLFGGEVFPPKHLRALMLQWPQARFSNVYGPAEVNQCTFHHMDTPPADDAVLPIGPIWPNAEGLVLGPDEAVLPPGEAGELVVRTPTMMQGYWNRPALNDRAFYHRPRAGGRTDLFYRTGDLVRQDEAGTYWFLGRQDRQIKARGYRIELDEVEAALLAHAAVAEAAVYAVPGPNGGHQVQAALLLHPGPAPTPREILAHAAQNLPAFALPARLDIIDQFPRTSTGKIDRRALRARAVTTT